MVKIIFVDNSSWKVWQIQYFAKYWLINNELLIFKQEKYQKTIKIIDDKDIAKKCQIWICK